MDCLSFNMKTLVLIALPNEAPDMVNLPFVFFTGVGKVNAAITTAQLIERYQPKHIINFGTAGGITQGAGFYDIKRFVQRDMNCTGLGFLVGQTPYDEVNEIAFGEGLTCSTGDDFVNDPVLTIPADVVDMEAYAIAKACHLNKVDFSCYKYITDQADGNAAIDWQLQAAKGQDHYLFTLKELGVY